MSGKFLSETARSLPVSGIDKFFDAAASMKGVVSLGVGEPDFYTPWTVREEAIYSLEKRRTTYTTSAGLLPLRQGISDYLARRFDQHYNPHDEILVTVGVSEAIDLAFRAVLDAGDEVLLPEPCYVSYRACIALAGGVAVSVPLRGENDFRLTPGDILPHITPRTKAIILCYPGNPTGAVMTAPELEALADVLREKDIFVISDEIYAELNYTPEGHASIANLMKERALVLNGFSKAFAMTGWRLGYACGPAELIAAMTRIHQYVIMSAVTMAQLAGIEALKNGMEAVEHMRAEYNDRRRFMLHHFKRMGLDCFEPLGAFYLFPSIKKTGLTSEEFCTRLLTEEKLAIVPGTAFGPCGEGFVRCSYAYSVAELGEAVRRLEIFLTKIMP